MPTVRPNPASAIIHPSILPISRPSAGGWGQSGKSVTVRANARTARLESGPAARPGIGTNANKPDTRASTSRKPHSVARLSVRLACIAAEIAEQCCCESYQFGGHPGQQQQQAEQKCRQAWNGPEGGVLDGSQHLQQTHCYSDHESDGQNRQSQPEDLEQGVTEDFNRDFGRHVE